MREPKETSTMAKPNARPSGMAMVSTAAHPRQPHRDGLVDVEFEVFFQILKPAKIGKENN